ncbi:MAG: sigma-70 family RNA polymerase sigma factor [Bacteroidetes bacterium]|jgi:RNA polymerase sigma factor (TIGR02999 family)|nr:sigma-70 family RNA polymerase sigma factor [Bacteroidota bacterium]
MSTSADATRLLVKGRQGHKEAIDALIPQVLTELKEIAHRLLQRRPAGDVLDTTGLVHEAYLKLVDHSRVEWSDRAHFQALAARAMRQILVDHFRSQQREKRGGHVKKVTLREGEVPIGDRGEILLAIDEALDRLADTDARKAQVVTCRFFGGMSHRATADVLGVSTRTVQRDWRMAKAWLARWLGPDGEA